ncbi:hypothetical protein Pcinc_019922 [Petrolisthes cinctipes]|uniref:Inosine/uridine-preferring nucleoside hydrolase domain-containing protein n=1 Tax=Petrolisthes cinctipes TaxID=88211 RepID=A0AAE1FKK7_PETCI|nr:hypothetical protein Pcinc_019922 [Petrolisthes cinctipes]
MVVTKQTNRVFRMFQRMIGRKVIIDTDAGRDDALAIFMALEAHKRREVEVIAITTVNGNTIVRNVNNNVQRILHAVKLQEKPFHGHDGFGDVDLPVLSPPPPSIQQQHAVWALVNLVKKYPGEIVLVALGPLTNLALAQRLDPDFTSNLQAIYVMGGNTTGEGNWTSSAEYNFMLDPEAARVVFEETSIPINLTPWEICYHNLGIPYDVRKEMGQIKSKAAELMNKIEADILKNKYEAWITCDQVAMAWMIDDVKNGNLQKCQNIIEDHSSKEVIKDCLATVTKRCYASVELNGEITRGQMVIDHLSTKKRSPNLNILSGVNMPLYISECVKGTTLFMVVEEEEDPDRCLTGAECLSDFISHIVFFFPRTAAACYLRTVQIF